MAPEANFSALLGPEPLSLDHLTPDKADDGGVCMVPTPELQVPRQCSGCQHFHMTYDPERPYGCRAFGFLSRRLPCLVVLAESGRPCDAREPRPKAPPKPAPKRT